MNNTKFLLIDDTDGETSVRDFPDMEKLLKSLDHHTNISYLRVFEITKEIKLTAQPSIIVDSTS